MCVSRLSGDHWGSLEKQGVLTFWGVHFYFLFINFYWSIVSLQCCAVFLLHRRGNQPYVFMYPLCFRFPSPLGHHRALSQVPHALQQGLISFLFYT